jgi:hypothetical protein
MNDMNSTIKQQEEVIQEMRTALEQAEVDRNESIFIRVEVQMLRDANLKLRVEHDRLRSVC